MLPIFFGGGVWKNIYFRGYVITRTLVTLFHILIIRSCFVGHCFLDIIFS